MDDLALPDSLAARPRDRRGLPVPWVNETPAGDPDFAVIQAERSLRCARERRCGVCGEPLTYWIAFLGGQASAESRAYVDPPMHEPCAEASTRLCPHMSRQAPHRSAKVAKRDDVITPNGFVEAKPPEFWMYVTRGFTWRVTADGGLIYRPERARFIRRFVYDDEGRLGERPAVRPAP